MKEDAHGAVRIPDKFYFKIGEVSHIADVPAYVLRFWETEFKQIKPKRTDAGQRLYRKQDVALVLRIKRLLYDRKFTIEGAMATPEEENRQVRGTDSRIARHRRDQGRTDSYSGPDRYPPALTRAGMQLHPCPENGKIHSGQRIGLDRKILTGHLFCLNYYGLVSGHSSVGRVQASQAWCREFESRCPLHFKSVFVSSGQACRNMGGFSAGRGFMDW